MKPRNSITPTNSSDPTPERLLKSRGDFTVGDDEQGTRVYTFRDSPLERMRDRYKQIDYRQYAALAKYRHHTYAAGMMGNISAIDFNRIFATDVSGFSGMAKTENQAFHRDQYRKAVKEIGLRDSVIVDSVVIKEIPLEIAGRMRGWLHPLQARAVATDVIRGAADRLSILWGI